MNKFHIYSLTTVSSDKAKELFEKLEDITNDPEEGLKQALLLSVSLHNFLGHCCKGCFLKEAEMAWDLVKIQEDMN